MEMKTLNELFDHRYIDLIQRLSKKELIEWRKKSSSINNDCQLTNSLFTSLVNDEQENHKPETQSPILPSTISSTTTTTTTSSSNSLMSSGEGNMINGKKSFVKQPSIRIDVESDGGDTKDNCLITTDHDLGNAFVHLHNLPKLNEKFYCRPLRRSDYQYIELLRQLTTVGDLSIEQFQQRYDAMRSCGGTYYICVIVDKNEEKIVAAATLVREQKFIHRASSRARIEDVVVDSTYRGMALGKYLMCLLTNLSFAIGSYKVSLECTSDVVMFYTKFNFQHSSNMCFMQHRWFD
ncbi:hypothetical protein SNEBB_009376 [Seison nebaliae]|nr:hypothetical protein SNEBB_009376 [Seison nebaliae]